MDPRSEVLLRQADLFTGRVLLAGLPADGLLSHLPQAQGWCWNAADRASLTARFGERIGFGTEVPTGEIEGAVLFVPKAKEFSAWLLACLAANLNGKPLYLVGEKRGGIEGAARQLEAFGKPRKLDSARHCQLWQVQVENAAPAPSLESQANAFSVEAPGGALNVVSLPGVFSHGRLDRGTALLLKHLDGLPEGPLLDFGCGAGIVGAALKRRYPQAIVTLLDVDAFAIAASALTLKANGLEAQLICTDGIEGAPVDQAAIISNPPFHTGVHTHYAASENLLGKSSVHLRKGGEIRLVANSFLRYPPLLEAALGHCETLDEGDGFKIYRAKKG
ncbi:MULTISPECIES: class I SAM-dependent methyltransferase [unclassified Pseudomonas]|uniref:class I SAM-dependent methyltransferase n=1 Tax=unclassified Pseudomonas TaxID=196821 RepID=UPI000BC8C47C|nr:MULTISPECIES: class I SAM-dependent methyltransferase [unclassified Pseudomonas]PVZ15966.1 16S rRNA m(2)G 1207 methyltransferase [Pseudomonas sp. URIL14HWK12:I12]PVZ26178.1 16S rRNA m(2)G 1207 methyltransferase [Pseudomonas sp. URIL14HWK12:I10]PVZ36298.1 16S rRNA m(2)G 1207 methyltransferase [Pseudomonas sp. URIL14HWK12:I11]SNZ18349.1 16S rRNA m(2)G 1207 methyltransferase [Pseudomonas sp. URIL14HWK12:I9]